MAHDSTIKFRIDEETKDAALEILDAEGLSMSVAIRMFLRHMVEIGHFPYEFKKPNAKTLAAMKELEDGLGIRSKTVAELMKQLNARD